MRLPTGSRAAITTINAEHAEHTEKYLYENSAISAISALNVVNDLVAIAQDFLRAMKACRRCGRRSTCRGLDRLLGDARTIGEELRREAARRGVRARRRGRARGRRRWCSRSPVPASPWSTPGAEA